MRKSNLISLLIAGLIFTGFATPVKAGTVLSVQSLPSYINYRDFKLSCTSNSTSVTFSVSKHGGGAVTFATINPASGCVAQVTSSQITEETDYTFIVTDNDNPSLTRSTSTIFDNSGPSPVSGYYKEGLPDGFKIHWTNPSDGDFAYVKIYRGDTSDFSADGSHEVTTQPGGAGAPMTYEDHFTMIPGKTYYYNLRAIDKAGNSSGLVGDGGGTVTIYTTPTPGTSQRVTIFPKEESQGSVLGTEATPSPTPEATISPNIVEKINTFANTTPEPLKWILTHKKISIGILLVLAAAGYGIYALVKRNK